MSLTHIDKDGHALMVDVSQKNPSFREAVAKGEIRMAKETLALIMDGEIKKGDVLAAARIAGIMAAKKTDALIPLCHPLPLESVRVDLLCDPETGKVLITATAATSGKTGVEMEALTAATVAALTIYDMCKAADKYMVIGDIRLIRKSGGKSGLFIRQENQEY